MVRSDCPSIPGRGPLRLIVFLGLMLSLSACASRPPARTAFFWPVGATYRVHAGDTLSQIAHAFRISDAALVAYNQILNPNRIYPGEVLRIPPGSYVPAVPAASGPALAVITPTPRPMVRLADDARPMAPRFSLPQARESAPGVAPHFLWPVSGKVIEAYGALPNGGRNDGINIATREGAPIRAAASGTVVYAGDGLKAYGNLVLIRHRDGYITAYAHAERLLVARNDHVRAGQVIGYAGRSGGVRVPQLHFEIRHGAEPLNPAPLLLASASS